ncbi:MAG: hypothetical protein K6T81_09270 [Alicyclobacillus macrosporangiidus]|uniref:hypothetical protein n=1 Tax=Alicyclobacillus macrosporangiidus TaxID=392015 RepID=UPI0026EA980A|nr:hypothetical protein [Alicyclobacillus macrosporangiidus]MCL6598920.1 hypothetical protein [Alicyclobacillus macrosporangiidus]
MHNSFVAYHHAYSGLSHELGRSVVHGIGWGIGYQLVRHLPFILIVLIALGAVVWYVARRRG